MSAHTFKDKQSDYKKKINFKSVNLIYKKEE